MTGYWCWVCHGLCVGAPDQATHPSERCLAICVGVIEVAGAVREAPGEWSTMRDAALRIVDRVAGRDHAPKWLLQVQQGGLQPPHRRRAGWR